MKKIISLLAGAILVAGCAAPGQFHGTNTNNNCDGKGKVRIEIKYGDSKIQVTPKSDTKRKGEVIYDLKADTGYDTVLVTITGKTGADAWLNKSGTEAGGDPYVCVPDNQASAIYSFEVNVAGVGTIDPRVEVLD